MALIIFPITYVLVSQQNMSLEYRQAVLEARSTSNVSVVSYGPARWHGTIIFVHRAQSGMHSYDVDRTSTRIESFFASLNGEVNETRIPHYRPTIISSIVTSADSVFNSEGILEHPVTSDPSASMSVGDMVTVTTHDRVFQVSSVGASSFVLEPQMVLPSGTQVMPTNTIRVRQSGEQSLSTRNVDFPNPWTFNWVESPLI